MITMTRHDLAAAIRAAAYLEGDFLLRSGRRSKYYLDKYRFETQPHLLQAIAEHIVPKLPSDVQRLAGAELGGVPLATAVALATGLPFVIIRNERKDYGTSNQFEGLLDKGDRVVLLEDIATTGGQTVEAVKTLRAAEATVAKVIVVIDRGEGARAHIESAGVAYECLFTSADLGITPPGT